MPIAKSVWNEPMIWMALLVKAVLLSWVLATGHWHLGDTDYYLQSASLVCGGAWGADTFRTPLYPWFICGLSAGGIPLVLIVQSLLSWGIGVWLLSRESSWRKQAAILWFFDPVYLVYGPLVMTEALFSILVLFLALQMNRVFVKLNSATLFDAAVLGMLFAGILLDRPIGQPMILMSIGFLALGVLRRKFPGRMLGVAVLTTLVLIAPRLLWDHERTGHWNLAEQGGYVLTLTAGVVENQGLGLDFQESQAKWYSDHPVRNSTTAIQSILHHFPTFLFLSTKGALRTLIGHVNLEWAYVASGKNVIGPGWFKTKEHTVSGTEISGPMELTLWCLGILWAALFSVWGYFQVWRRIVSVFPNRTFLVWVILSIAILIGSAQVYGDARFRVPIWAIAIGILVCPPNREKNPTQPLQA